MFRPLKRPPKGAWSRHLQAQREQRDLSAVAAFELVYERIGWSPKSRTAYMAIDSGARKPNADEAAVLAAEFGWPPDPVDDLPAPDQGALIAALQQQTDALRELAAEMRLSRVQQDEAAVQMMRALAAVAGGQAPRETRDANGSETPAGTGR